MPPDRGRASRACASCRKQKTRCYEPRVSGKACLRCERLRQKCSLVQFEEPPRETAAPAPGTDSRLERLERTMATLLDRLGEGPSSAEHELSRPTGALITPESGDPTYKDTGSSVAPIIVIRDLASDPGIKPSTDMGCLGALLDDLIAPDLALTFITIFLEYYGRWILFDPESNPAALLPRVKRSPLLFCACCLIAVRHTSEELAASLAPKLYDDPHPLYVVDHCGPSTIKYRQLALSGFALQHCQSSPLFTTVTSQTPPSARMDEKTFDRCCLWNHLCLAHLHYCVGTSRRSMLQAWQIERCRAIIDSHHATNFELRMVAEIHLYWTVYEHLIEESADLLKSVAALQAWKRKWAFVLEQPRSQFVLMGFHVSNLLLYQNALKSKTAWARDSLVSEMIRHSIAIVNLAMDTVDERTRHLSDHIYHMITFAAIIICRLLNSYESQLGMTFNIRELDALIQSLVQWLHSIGMPCHAAHKPGNIIAKVHQKLRPRVEKSPLVVATEDILEENFTNYYFPEFLGLGTSADGNWDLLSDLSFFPQSPSTSWFGSKGDLHTATTKPNITKVTRGM